MTRAMSTFAPKKNFSQNFLTDAGIARKIVGALSIGTDDIVIEIGPGKGMLTKLILESPAKQVVAVELDPRAIQFIKDQSWSSNRRLQIHQGDFLNLDIGHVVGAFTRSNSAIIGNIPYAITSPILFSLFQARTVVSRSVIMMQREVARRCVASVGSKEYGILSVATWYCSVPQSLFVVKAGSFFPKPNVDSAVVRFELRSESPVVATFETFMDFVRSAFSQRRKVIANALAPWVNRVTGRSLRDDGLQLGPFNLAQLRAEQLSPVELHEIMQLLLKRQDLASV